MILSSRHGGVDPALLTFVANQLDCVLQMHGRSCDNGTGDEEAQSVLQVYNALCKQIRALDLPLNVNSIQGISSVFRGTEVRKTLILIRNFYDQHSVSSYNVSTVSSSQLMGIKKTMNKKTRKTDAEQFHPAEFESGTS